MKQHLKGKVAIVTGGGRGIGREVCLLLGQQGAKVVVNDLGGDTIGGGASQTPADEVVTEIKKAGGDAVANYQSVATVAGGESIVKTALDTFGRLDIVVHCAGILRDRMVYNMTEEEWDSVINVHLKGMFCIGRPATMVMRQQKSGAIIGFSSLSGMYGNAGQANYGAAKDGIAGFVRTVSKDVFKYGVTVNGIAPAAATRLTATVSAESREKAKTSGVTRVMGEASATASSAPVLVDSPADIAPMVVYLCTDEAKFITGQFFYVQAGQVSLLENPHAERTIEKLGGMWTIEEIAKLLPTTLGKDMYNPAPPQTPKA
ncbi:MAG: SDR family NAD(P)-dependent oxidoreductase [Chloroflexi bacterium]|nr:SDR family NAD(P)-dependent oxidoreductase [Chloroflexota bacterium]